MIPVTNIAQDGPNAPLFDLVVVFHQEENYRLAQNLFISLQDHETDGFHLLLMDNRPNNLGFAKAANLGALEGQNPYIGFLNPDLVIKAPFLNTVSDHFDSQTQDVICGEAFGKPAREVHAWGCKDWVCGAAFFVRRAFWEDEGGFDERFVWGWEETDLIRRAEAKGRGVSSIHLPGIEHLQRPDSPQDALYKGQNFDLGAKNFYTKWGKR